MRKLPLKESKKPLEKVQLSKERVNILNEKANNLSTSSLEAEKIIQNDESPLGREIGRVEKKDVVDDHYEIVHHERGALGVECVVGLHTGELLGWIPL